MPWLIYNYPKNSIQSGSYTLASGTPVCSGLSLCAIYSQVQLNTIPARPVLNQSVLDPINAAIGGVITNGVTLLDPSR